MDAFAYAEAYSDALADALATALADASADAHSIVYCHFWHGINDAPPQSLQLVASPDPLRLLKADKVLATELLLDAVKEHPIIVSQKTGLLLQHPHHEDTEPSTLAEWTGSGEEPR